MFIWSTLEQFKRHHQSCYSGYGGWHVHDATESITFLDVPKMTALCSFSTSHLMSVRITFVILQSAHAQEDKVWGQKWSASSEQSSYVTYIRSHLSSMLSRYLPEILIPSREELYTSNGYSSITNEPTYRRGCLLPFQVAPHRFSSTEKVFTSQSDKEDPTLLKRMRVPLLCESCRATFSLRRSRPYDTRHLGSHRFSYHLALRGGPLRGPHPFVCFLEDFSLPFLKVATRPAHLSPYRKTPQR